mgnify:CR=1 FL=1
MKLKTLFFTCIFFISLFSFAQKTHTITLNVDTGKITKSTVNQYSNFGQSSNISNEDFTIEVNLGDTVNWIGVSSSNSNDIVKIESINHQGGARVFAKNVLRGNDNGVVSGLVKKGRAGDSEKYNVKFRVYYNGVNKSKLFKIDPKIVIR